MQSWQAIVAYLFHTPGPAFNYYAPFIVGIAFIVAFAGYHYVLEARRRFRNHGPVLRFLDIIAAWSSGAGLFAALVLLARHSNAPVVSWRIWLYLYVIAVGVAFLVFLVRLYRQLPRALAAHDNELLKRRYLAPANQRQVANAPARRAGARR